MISRFQIFIFLFLFVHLSSQGMTESKIRLGLSTALTGNAQTWGKDVRDSVIFAAQELAPEKYELIIDDDKCDSKAAVTVAKRFIDIEKPTAVLGFACSGTVFPTAELYGRAGMPVMVVTASAAGIADLGPHVFRTWPSDQLAAETLREYVQAHHKNIGVLTEQTEYAESFLQSFQNPRKSGGKLEILNEYYLSDQMDYRSLLTKLRTRKVESLFVNSASEATALAVVKQLREMNFDVPIYAAYWPASPIFVRDNPKLADGLIFVDAPSAASLLKSEGSELYSKFTKQFGEFRSVDFTFLSAFEGFRALDAALRNQAKTGEKVEDFLSRTTFHGLAGDWSFDEKGEIKGIGFFMKTIQDGKVLILPNK
jgi:branched-chain amino acid transport system substrate-binding protein